MCILLIKFAQTDIITMLKLQTPVDFPKSSLQMSYDDTVVMLGSCFTDSIGGKISSAGYDVIVNPFGTLYNPVSIRNSITRLASGTPFTKSDCVEMGSGAGLICSFSHHTSFARKTTEEFLQNANESLAFASSKFSSASLVVITLGTSWCYYNRESGEVVSNCLKRKASEFERKMLPMEESLSILESIVTAYPEKRFIFTVSPIRHLSDGATANLVSKSSLVLAVNRLVSRYPQQCGYFPSFEIMNDQLRDYRFYAQDMVHPSGQAIDYIWERFVDWVVPDSQRQTLEENLRQFRRSQHRQML